MQWAAAALVANTRANRPVIQTHVKTVLVGETVGWVDSVCPCRGLLQLDNLSVALVVIEVPVSPGCVLNTARTTASRAPFPSTRPRGHLITLGLTRRRRQPLGSIDLLSERQRMSADVNAWIIQPQRASPSGPSPPPRILSAPVVARFFAKCVRFVSSVDTLLPLNRLGSSAAKRSNSLVPSLGSHLP